MSHVVAIGHSDIRFCVGADETILDAAERAGYALPYSCRKGVCTSCEAPLREGTVSLGSRHVTGPAPAILLCRAKPSSDVTILPHRVERRDPSARTTINARVFRLHRPAPDVVTLLLRFPVSIRARFKAGQYLRVVLPDGDTRNYSLANAPAESDGAHLHIRHVPGGKFSEQVLAHLQQGDELKVEVPYGDFFLRDASDAPIVLLGTGTGFAPLKSIVEDLVRRGMRRPCRLYWGGRTASDLYMSDLPRRWTARHAWFSFHPVLSQADEAWTGRRGLVHEALMDDLPDLNGHQVYACGNPAMVRGAQHDLPVRCRLDPNDFYADAFVPTGSGDRV